VVKKYVAIREAAGGGSVGELVASEWLNDKVCKACERSNVIKAVKFDLVKEGPTLIKRSSAGEDYVDFVLTDTLPDLEGVTLTEELLQQWAEGINQGDVIVGDIDHEEYDYVVSNIPDPDEASSIIKNMKKGIAKGVKAFLRDGKLFVRAIIDKRYKKIIEKAKGVSLEALLDIVNTPDGGKVAASGKLLGFTFAVNDDPVNPRAVIVS